MAGNSKIAINKLKISREPKFKIDNRGDIECFLGMRTLKKEKGMILHQEKYTQNFLEQFNIQDCKTSKTPAGNNLKLGVAQLNLVRV